MEFLSVRYKLNVEQEAYTDDTRTQSYNNHWLEKGHYKRQNYLSNQNNPMPIEVPRLETIKYKLEFSLEILVC